MITLHSYEVDAIVDVLRECRAVLRTEDLLDGDLDDSIAGALETLGVEDPYEQ